MKYIILLFLFLSLNLNSQTLTGKLVRVSDGDTVVLLDSTNTQHKIRLDGIDCPEKGQDYGAKATEFVREITKNRTIKVGVKGKDRYSRILGILYADDINVNEELLRNGLAWHYKSYNKSKEYAEMEVKAKKSKLNIWSMPNAIAPWDWRKGTRVSEVVEVEGEVFYICNGPNAYAYHTSESCRGLNRCSTTLQKINKAQTKEKKRRPCKMCCE